MSTQYDDGEQRDCLDCHGTLEFDADDGSWHHIDGGNSCSRYR
ncbi:hypothetical protein [Halosimplex pelagicum]|jgi:hypothetical protein|nr:hypothetical protein [Halosimplex pelagicum]